jgi:hypothetical protein
MTTKNTPPPPRKVRINEEKGLKPAQNPPPMPQVKPPKAEKKS